MDESELAVHRGHDRLGHHAETGITLTIHVNVNPHNFANITF